MKWWYWLAVFCTAAAALAQQGDTKGEQQVARVPAAKIPPAPALSPEAALRTFKLQPGFRIELVAADPLVETPVAMAFDPDGHLWVVEMRGFMPNLDGLGETEPIGRISKLTDSDGDGRMDTRTVFLDGLVLPRSLAFVRDGVLVAEPPKLWFCRDTNGDGKCDEKTEVAGDYGATADPKLGLKANPEHASNGLLRALDNWIYSANHSVRYRSRAGGWERDPTPGRGQWGITQDDFGRLFFNSNEDQLRGDLVPSHYLTGKAGGQMPGLNVKIAEDQAVFPSRVTPGVNRGYRAEVLREDGRLAKFTAACGPCVYRGDQFPARFRGNAFVCEPAANLVRRNLLFEKDGVVTATNAYPNAEFLTSTDERFRPVNLSNGPDGALYVVDLYHGILEHRYFMTSYLREQIRDRGLDKSLQKGRIYRIVYKGVSRPAPPRLAGATSADLVNSLGHSNGWWRDTAQRLLVERGDSSVLPALRLLAVTGPRPVARLHALWTLEGLDSLDAPTLQAAARDEHPKLRAAALRLAESKLVEKTGDAALGPLRSQVLGMVRDTAPDVQVQFALTLGEIAPDEQSRGVLQLLQQSAVPLARQEAAFSLARLAPAQAAPTNVVQASRLGPEEQKQFEIGKSVFEATCLACHQQHGMGQEGLAPPMVGSEWIAGAPERLVRIVLHGMRGPIHVKKQTWELDMPSLGILEDDQIAAAITYVRKEWGHAFSAVPTDLVKQIRATTAARDEAWTEAELLRIR